MSDAHVEVFRDGAGEWRWRKVAANNRIVSTSGEGFERRDYAYESAARENPGVTIAAWLEGDSAEKRRD